MPELPEVETIKRDLARLVINKEIAAVEIRALKMISPADFAKRLKGLKIKGIGRRAKLLVFEMSNGSKMLIHLKLTGQLIFGDNKERKVGARNSQRLEQETEILPNKFSRVIFTFSDSSRLFFNDVRKFGYLKIVKKNELERIENEYGVEPLSKNFTLRNFVKILARRPNLKIKQLLIDQTLIAGLGNIYSDEACYLADIKPLRRAGNLKETEIKRLFRAIIKVLKKSTARRGTSADNYVDARGRQGGFAPFLMVYGRAGEECKKCRTILKSLKIGGRTSVYCPRCQL